jgi:DNA-binding transcriptional MerR regulator
MSKGANRVKKSAEAYRSIGEAADELGLQPHVLRYWEGKFTRHLKPLKRPDGRRMFRPDDIRALKAIQLLVHEKGLTLKGAGQLLKEQGVEAVLNGDAVLSGGERQPDRRESPAKDLQDTVRAAFVPAAHTKASLPSRSKLEAMLADLENIKARLDAARLERAA